MIRLIFIAALLLLGASLKAQDRLQKLPQGKYEARLQPNQMKWEQGDLQLINESRYSLTSESEAGEYKFSAAAQRVFFTTGPLKGYYASTSTRNGVPAIIFPASENFSFSLHADVVALWRK